MRSHNLNYPALRSPGFTLVETMVVVSIAVVLVGIGTPSFKALLDNHRLATTVNEFIASINLTRARAIDTGGRVHLAPTDGVDWNKGWTVYINKKKDSNLQFDQGDTLIAAHDAVHTGINITSSMSDNTFPYIAYNGTGYTRTNMGDQQFQTGNITFVLGKNVRCVSLNFGGRPRLYKPDTGSTACSSQD